MSEGLFASLSGTDVARLQLWSIAGPATYAKLRSWHTGWDLERRYRAADRYPVLWLFDPAAPRLVTSPPVVAFPEAATKVRGRQTLPAARRALLGVEVPRLYQAMSFMNWRYGVMFNCHVVLTFKLMGFADHRTPVSLMASWNQAMKRWLAVGPDKPRARWKKRARAGAASEHLWMYAVEHGRDQGLHAHELCVVPREQVAAFTAYAKAWWERAAGMKLPEEAVYVRHRRVGDEEKGYRRQVGWFRYVVKTLGNEVTITDHEGRLHNGRQIFGLKDAYWESSPVEVPRLAGVCRALSRKEQVAAGFVSRWDEGRLEELFTGWEFEARRERLERDAVTERMMSVFRQMDL